MNTELEERKFVFDRSYREGIELDDGTPVRLRLLRPEDRDALKEGFERLSEETKYRRFLSAKSQLSQRELDYLCDVDQYDHVALAAELAKGEREGEGIAAARCIRLEEDPTIGEAAITVVDEFQHQGLGGQMLDRLVGAARERGIETIRATLFRENESMRRLLESIGDETEVVEYDGPIVTVDVEIGEEGSTLPVADAPREIEVPRDNPLRSILSLAARGVVSVVEKFPPWRDEDNRKQQRDRDGSRK